MSCVVTILEQIPIDQALFVKFHKSRTLSKLILTALQLGLALARYMVESELEKRSKITSKWETCPQCGSRIESKGFRPRSIFTLLVKFVGNGE